MNSLPSISCIQPSSSSSPIEDALASTSAPYQTEVPVASSSLSQTNANPVAAPDNQIKQRLKQSLGREKDILGETIAQLYVQICDASPQDILPLADLLKRLRLPAWIVSTAVRRQWIEKGIQGLHALHQAVSKLEQALSSITTHTLHAHIQAFITYVNNFIGELLAASDARKRQALGIQCLKQSRDLLKTIHASSSTPTREEKHLLQKLASVLKPPSILLEEAIENSWTAHPIETSDPALHPLHLTIKELQQLLDLPSMAPYQEGVKRLLDYYQSFLCDLIKATSPKERQMLLTPKAQVVGDGMSCLLIDADLARTLASMDEWGALQRCNKEGAHAVTAWGGLHWKVNPFCGEFDDDLPMADFLQPGKEYIAASLCHALSPYHLIAAPTAFIQIASIPVWSQGHSLHLTHRSLQVGYTIGYQDPLLPNLSPAHQIKAMPLSDLARMLDYFNDLVERLPSEDLLNSWDHLLTMAQKEHPSQPAKLFEAYTAWMQKLPLQARLVEFAAKGDFVCKGLERGLQIFCDQYLKKWPENDFHQLLEMIQHLPALVDEKINLAYLVELPCALRLIAHLLPGKSFEEIVSIMRALPTKIDHQAFSQLVLASLLLTPSDGKPDNYLVELEWENGLPSVLRIVCIDSDRILEPALRKTASGNHLIRLQCFPLMLFYWMQMPLFPPCQAFLSQLDTNAFLLDWALQLDRKNQAYKRLIAQGFLKEADLKLNGHEKKLDFPLDLPQGLFHNLAAKLQTIQTLAKQGPTTHHDLFAALEPIVSTCYQKGRESAPSPLDLYVQIRKACVQDILGQVEGEDPLPYQEIPLEEEIANFLKGLTWHLPKDLAKLKQVMALSFCPLLQLTHAQKQKLLLLAIQQGDEKLARFALSQGAKVTVADEAGQTPLHVLMRNYAAPFIDTDQLLAISALLLEQKDIDPNAIDHQQSPPLFSLINRAGAAPERFVKLLDQLVQRGADLDLPDLYPASPHYGLTPLEKAMQQKDLFVFQALVKKGAGRAVHPSKLLSFMQAHAHALDDLLSLLDAQLPAFGFLRALQVLSRPSTKEDPSHLKWTGVHSFRFCSAIEEQLAPFVHPQTGRFVKPPDTYGRSAVVQASHAGFHLHFKPDPELPGVQYSVERLRTLLFGYPTLETELFKKQDKAGKAYPVLVSQTVAGQNLQDALTQGIDLEELDLYRLHNAIIACMLIHPEDDKPDNYILQTFINHEGKEKLQLICIDSDHAWVPPFAGNGALQVKCILFCLDQMRKPLHPKTRVRLLQIQPLALLCNWLKDLEVQEKHYASLFVDDNPWLLGYWRSQPPKASTMMPAKTAARLYQSIIRLQHALQSDPHDRPLTPLDLLIQLQPKLGRCYEASFSATTPLARFIQVAGTSYGISTHSFATKTTAQALLKSWNQPLQTWGSTNQTYTIAQSLQEIEELQRQGSPSHLKQVAQSLAQGDVQPFYALLTDGLREQALNHLQIGHQQRELVILKAMLATSFYQLHLSGCQTLDSNLLKRLLEASPSLATLDAKGCPQLHYFSFDELSCLKTLHLAYCPHLTSLTFYAPKLLVLNLKGNEALTSLHIDAPLLEELELEGCKSLPANQIQTLAAKCPNLKRLTLKGCNLTTLPYHTLIMQHPLLLRYNLNKFRKPFMESLSAWLMDGHKHVHLSVQGSEEVKLLSDPFIDYPPLMHLTISYSHSIDDMWASLFSRYHSLTQLTFHRCQISPLACKDLDALTSLVYLKITESKLDSECIKALSLVLGGLTSFMHLTISGNDIGPEGAKILAPTLAALVSLIHLDISENNIGAEGTQALAPTLAKLDSLAHLDISWNKLGKEGAQVLAPALAKLTSLLQLDISENDMGIEGIQALAPALAELTSLLQLDISKNNIRAEGIQALAPALAKLTSLTHLAISWNYLGEEGAQILAPALAKLSCLTQLDISENGIAKEGANALAPVLAELTSLRQLDIGVNGLDLNIRIRHLKTNHPLTLALKRLTLLTHLSMGRNLVDGLFLATILPKLTSLTHLRVGWNKMTFLGAKSLAPALATLVSLTHLEIDYNGLGYIGVQELAPALAKLTSLMHLDIGANMLGDEGAQTLAPVLSELTLMTHLSISTNGIKKAGMQALAPALAKLASLTYLNIRSNELGDEGAQALAPALANLAFVTHLDISSNQIKKAGAQALAPALAKLASLTHLSIRGNELGDEGAQALAPALANLGFITQLDLRWNKIREKGIQALAPALAKLAFLTQLKIEE